MKYSNIMRPPSSQTEEHSEEILIPIMEGLATKKQNYPLTIMYTDTSVISFCYTYLENNLGNRQYIGDPIPENRIFAQYHQTYTDKMKSFIVQEICKSNSRIRFVMCTVALGMGLNALHVRHDTLQASNNDWKVFLGDWQSRTGRRTQLSYPELQQHWHQIKPTRDWQRYYSDFCDSHHRQEPSSAEFEVRHMSSKNLTSSKSCSIWNSSSI